MLCRRQRRQEKLITLQIKNALETYSDQPDQSSLILGQSQMIAPFENSDE